MSRVIIFSRQFPAYHPKKGQPTFFVEKIFTDLYLQNLIDNNNMDEPLLEEEIKNFYTKTWEPKGHTIRAGNRWKVGDWFSPRVWSGKPYASKQIIIAPLIELKNVYDITILGMTVWVNGKVINSLEYSELAANDGLSLADLKSWFSKPPFNGQILCWNDKINY